MIFSRRFPDCLTHIQTKNNTKCNTSPYYERSRTPFFIGNETIACWNANHQHTSAFWHRNKQQDVCEYVLCYASDVTK